MSTIPREVKEEGQATKVNKQIPPGCELVPSHCSGQSVMYFLRRADDHTLVSSIPRSESGQCLYSKKTLRAFHKKVDRDTNDALYKASQSRR